MKTEKVLKEFEKAGALLKGHFILSSGLHSPMFLQKALVFMNPKRTSKLCKALAAKVADEIDISKVDAIVSPAVGGIIPGYETARHLGVPAMYVERENGEFVLRRGFPLTKGMRVLMVEDIVTTGESIYRHIRQINCRLNCGIFRRQSRVAEGWRKCSERGPCVFQRRVALHPLRRLREALWPSIGWRRATTYIWRRVWRLSGTPHTIAVGIAAGTFMSFTPFLGFHIVGAMLIAWVFRGNLVAAASGTIVGNPIRRWIWFERL